MTLCGPSQATLTGPIKVLAMFSEFDRLAMTRALALAERGLETAHPNPRVGCVIAKGERIIAEGWHERTGEAHAEIVALRSAKEPVAGATAYVTLEPCSHHGRTPPCVNALIEARLARVVFAVQDPNPRVSGQGAEALLRAGIAVEAGLMEAEATELNVGFMKRMKHGLPWVRIKLAMSLDGRTALKNGASQWITGEAARADVQRWRARSSAVMTGVGTVLADDPRLNVRAAGFKGRQPLRVVLDSYLRCPPGAKLFAGEPGAAGAGEGAKAVKPDPAADAGGQVIVFTAVGGGVPTAKAAVSASDADATDLGEDIADLVKAFESRPSSVTARSDELAASDSPAGLGVAASVAGNSSTADVSAMASGTGSSDVASNAAAGPPLVAGGAAAHPAAPAEEMPRLKTDAGGGGSAVSTATGGGDGPEVSRPGGASSASVPSGVTQGRAGLHPGGQALAGAQGPVRAQDPAGAQASSGAQGPTRAQGLAGAQASAGVQAPVVGGGPLSPAVFEARRAALLGRGARVEEVPVEDGFLDLFAVLQRLAKLEVNEVLVEAGPVLAGQLLTTFFADELLLYIAPKLLGPQGRPLVNLPELQNLQDAWGFSLFDAKRFGDDLRLRLRPK